MLRWSCGIRSFSNKREKGSLDNWKPSQIRCSPRGKKSIFCIEKLPVFIGLLTWCKQQQLKCREGEDAWGKSLLPYANGFLQQGKEKPLNAYILFASKNRQILHCSEFPSWWLSKMLILPSNTISVVCNNTFNTVYKKEIGAMTVRKHRRKMTGKTGSPDWHQKGHSGIGVSPGALG